MKTYIPKPDEIEKRWYAIDVDGMILGRAATQIARILRGKNKPLFTPHMDTGDYVVVVNAEKVRTTGNKETEKTYFRHTGYPGGTRVTSIEQMRQRKPEEVVRLAVRGMLPKNRLGRRLLKKLHVYVGPDHPHAAQRPEPLTLQ